MEGGFYSRNSAGYGLIKLYIISLSFLTVHKAENCTMIDSKFYKCSIFRSWILYTKYLTVYPSRPIINGTLMIYWK